MMRTYDDWKTTPPEDPREVRGERCPVCGRHGLAGEGPCSEACERVMTEEEDDHGDER
jgi:hypothetical protein